MAASDPTEIPHIAAFAKGAQENDHQLFRLDQGVTVMEQASCFATQKSPRTPIKPKKKVADSKIGH